MAMRKLHILLLTIAAVSALTLSVMVVAVPDRNGELRMSPEVGDFFTIEINEKSTQTFTVKEILEDGYMVEVMVDGDSSTIKMTQDVFYGHIHLDHDEIKGMERFGRIIMDTSFGRRTCTLYD
jgi:uncharacterized membrane protein YkoI